MRFYSSGDSVDAASFPASASAELTASGLATGLAATGLANGLDRLGTLAWPIAPSPIRLPKPKPAAAPEGAALAPMGDDDPVAVEARSFMLSFDRSCDGTEGSEGADQISLLPPAPVTDVLPLPSGGEEVIQPPELAPAVGADHVSLVPKILPIVLELNGGSPTAAVLVEPGAELSALESACGAGPKLSIVGS